MIWGIKRKFRGLPVGADDLDAIFVVEIDENGPGKVEFDSSNKNGLVMINFLQFYVVMVLKRVNYTVLLLILAVLHGYGPGMLEISTVLL